MEKELNIAAILEGKPSAKLWSPIIGDCTYSNYYPPTEEIIVNFTNRYGEEGEWNFHQSGRTLSAQNTAEVCLFPSKSMRDWSKFAWKKGDVLYAESIDNYCIFNKFTDDEYTTFEGKYLFDARNMDICNSNYFNESTNEFVKVSDDDAKIILSNLASLLGGKLNLSTLKIEKPQFKDGDIVVLDDDGMSHFKTILLYQSNINNEYEVYSFLNAGTQFLSLKATLMDDRKARPATDSEKQQLFDALAKVNKAWDAEKKAIVDLPKKCGFKPMDWCLMRDFGEKWKLCQFGFKDETEDADHAPYNAIGGNWFNECIPYNDQTAHLLGTTDDWEGGEE